MSDDGLGPAVSSEYHGCSDLCIVLMLSDVMVSDDRSGSVVSYEYHSCSNL